MKDMYSNDDNWEWRAELYIDAANVASRAAAKEFKPLLIAWLSRAMRAMWEAGIERAAEHVEDPGCREDMGKRQSLAREIRGLKEWMP